MPTRSVEQIPPDELAQFRLRYEKLRPSLPPEPPGDRTWVNHFHEWKTLLDFGEDTVKLRDKLAEIDRKSPHYRGVEEFRSLAPNLDDLLVEMFQG